MEGGRAKPKRKGRFMIRRLDYKFHVVRIGLATTYTTDDLSAETEPLKELALGRSYPAKKWPRFSVIVELSANSKPEHPEYTIGVARRPSAALEFFAPLFFDVPFKGMNEWKKQVAPECKNHKTGSSR